MRQSEDADSMQPGGPLPWSELVRLIPRVKAGIESKPDIKEDPTAWLREIVQCLWNAALDLQDITVEYAEEPEEYDVDLNDEQAVREHLDGIVDGARHDWGKIMQQVGELAAILFDARHEILDAADLRDVREILTTAYGLLDHICYLWDELDENSDFRDYEREWSRSDLEFAIMEMRTYAQDVTRHRHRLEECASQIGAYLVFHRGYSTQVTEPERKPNGPEEAGGATAGSAPIEHIQLENGAYKILHTLGSSPTRLHQEELTLCEDPPMDRKTVKRHLTALAEHGLIDYNPRDKKGAAITEKGRAYLNGPAK